MQIVSFGDNLHEMSKPIVRKILSLHSAEYAQRVVKVKEVQMNFND